MTQRKVNALLFVVILVMALCPLLGALYFVDRALTTSLNLGFNRQVSGALESSAQHLKTLGRLDPARRDQYRLEFERIEELKSVYSSGEAIKQSLRHSLLIYFALGVFAALVASLAFAVLLSRRISRSFHAAYLELSKNRERMRFLEELSSWQELAKMLAHEIKNPLTPIEVLVTSLQKGHREQEPAAFTAYLAQAEAMVLEELSHLKRIVDKFGSFAKLPAAQLDAADVRLLLIQHVNAIALMFDRARIRLEPENASTPLRAQIDATLFRQALVNIVRNGIEANVGRTVGFQVGVTAQADAIYVRIANDGVPVPKEVSQRMFDPYVTGKTNKENMGLGLAIVRKIVLEHGGEIAYEERGGHPEFVICLPRID